MPISAAVRKEIENYAKQIKTIELFVDSVRKNPGEYLSSIGNEGWMNCIREVFQNGIDEMSRPNSPCDQVWITYYEKTHRCIVEDNGRALAPEIINRVFTREHTSTNFDKKEHVYPSGLHGVGSKCVNAVSSRFSVYSFYLGHCYHMDFSEGKALPKYVKGKEVLPEELPNPQMKQGLMVDFEPDFSIMKQISISCMDVRNLVARIIPLTNPNNVVHFTGMLSNGKTISETLVNTEGVITYLKQKTDKPLIKPIVFGYDNGTMKADIAITWEANMDLGPDVITFANLTPVNTQLSTPSQGFIKGLTDFFRDYMNKIYLANLKKKNDVIAGDITSGLKAAVAAAHMNVIFDGQAKNTCKNPELFEFVRDLTKSSLHGWAKSCPEDLQKLCGYFKDVAAARTRAEKAKIDVTKKYRNSFLGLPSKFTKAERKEHLELFITEGLSASGPCEVGRNSLFQAVYPIRGKLPNAMSKPRDTFLKNEEVQDILTILGAGYGKNFDITKCPYDKVILLSDADPDGLHIRTLLLKFLLLYCRPLVEAGRVYIGISPLYHVNPGKTNWTYYTDKYEFNNYVMEQFLNNHEIVSSITKKKMAKSQVQNIIRLDEPYEAMLRVVADNFSIYPILLEDILIIRNFPYPKFKKFIEGKYRFLTVSQKNGVTVIEGQAGPDEKQQTIVMKQQLADACAPLYPYIDESDKRYIMDGKLIGLYELLKTFRESEPKNIERAKGLGSLDAREISISTLDPKNRKLIRYTTVDIDNEIKEMRQVNDDKFALLKAVDISQYEF